VFVNFVYYVLFLHVHPSHDLTEDTLWRGVLVFTLLSASAVVYLLFLVGRRQFICKDRARQ
jgi:hypothetical protein